MKSSQSIIVSHNAVTSNVVAMFQLQTASLPQAMRSIEYALIVVTSTQSLTCAAQN